MATQKTKKGHAMPCRVETYPISDSQMKDVNDVVNKGREIADSLTLVNDNLREHIISWDTSESARFINIGNYAVNNMQSMENEVSTVTRSLIYTDYASKYNDLMEEALNINKKLISDFNVLKQIIESNRKPSDKVILIIEDMQVRHRQEDIDRLVDTFSEKINDDSTFAEDKVKFRELLKKTINADVSKPLEPQLGFNPDDW